MKKLIIFILVAFVGLCSIYAHKSDAYVTVDNLLDKGIINSKEAVQAYSSVLTLDEKTMLYTEHQMNPGKYQLFNAVSFVGVGSYMQHDLVGGIVSSGLALGGFGCITLGALGISNMQSRSYGAYSSNGEKVKIDNKTQLEGSIAYFALGAGFLITDIVWGIVKPKLYANKNNKALKKALDFNSSAVSIAPAFNSDLKLNGASVAIALNF